MPQLSPMMGFILFLTAPSLYLVLLSGMSKKSPGVESSKISALKKSSLWIF